jgi:hypothetical protein
MSDRPGNMYRSSWHDEILRKVRAKEAAPLAKVSARLLGLHVALLMKGEGEFLPRDADGGSLPLGLAVRALEMTR